MPQELLREARAQAERSSAAIKGPVLLHIARVLTRVNPAEAETVLAEGLAVLEAVPEGARDLLLGEAAALAATISPPRAFEIVRRVSLDQESVVSRMLLNMLDHGHVAAAVAYLSDPPLHESYPFIAARTAIGRAGNDEARLRVARGAMRALTRPPSDRGFAGSGRHHAFDLFTFNWARLPVEEAQAIVRELVAQIQSVPDTRMKSSYGAGSRRVEFSSTHEHRLFQILGPLRHLDPGLADSVVKLYPDLSVAASEFPYGRESMDAAMRADPPPVQAAPPMPPHVIQVGNRLMPIEEAIRSEFREAFAVAFQEYAIDSDPARVNGAPQECWPSTAEFRSILFQAGRHEGRGAVRYLDRIPDPVLSLFARVELAAALAGLPQLSSRTLRPGPGGFGEMMRSHREAASTLPRAMAARPPMRKPNLPPLRELRVSRSTRPVDEGPTGGAGGDFVEIRNVSLQMLVPTLYDVPETRIDWPSKLASNARYDFVLVLPRKENREAIVRLVQDGIAAHFGLRFTSELRPRDVYVLTAPKGIKARPMADISGFGSFGIGAMSMRSIAVGGASPEDPSGLPLLPPQLRVMEILDGLPEARPSLHDEDRFKALRRQLSRHLAEPVGPGHWIGGIESALTLAELCETIENGLDRPLIDETHLSGTYRFSVQSQAASTLDFLHALCEAEGLVVTAERREVQILVIEAKGATPS